MSKLTFSFLLVHDDYQDSVSYEVDNTFNFDDVIDHICRAMNFDRKFVEVKSNLGFTIGNEDQTTQEVADNFGTYFKIIVHQNRLEEASNNAAQRRVVDKDRVDNEHKNNGDEVSTQVKDEHSDDSLALDAQEMFHDAVDSLFPVNPETWDDEDEGMIEMTFLPELDDVVKHLRVKFNSNRSVRELMDKVSGLFGLTIDDILMTSMEEDARIIEEFDIEVKSLLYQYGPVYVLYPVSMKSKVANLSEQIAKQVNELIYKYKK